MDLGNSIYSTGNALITFCLQRKSGYTALRLENSPEQVIFSLSFYILSIFSKMFSLFLYGKSDAQIRNFLSDQLKIRAIIINKTEIKVK